MRESPCYYSFMCHSNTLQYQSVLSFYLYVACLLCVGCVLLTFPVVFGYHYELTQSFRCKHNVNVNTILYIYLVLL